MSIEDQIVVIFSGVRGFLDKVEPNQITAFEKEFLPFVKSEHPDILKSIADTNTLTKETEEKLNKVCASFVESFNERLNA